MPILLQDCQQPSINDKILLLSNIGKVTHKAAVTSIEGAHDASLEYGEPVEEGGGHEALHHDDQHLGAGDLVLATGRVNRIRWELDENWYHLQSMKTRYDTTF